MPSANRLSFLFAAAALLAVTSCANAQLRIRPEQVISLKLEPAKIEAAQSATIHTTLAAEIIEGYQVNSTQPLQKYLVPTRIELDSEIFELVAAKFPEGKLKTLRFSEEKLSVFEGTVRAPLTLRTKKGAKAGNHTVKLVFYYQACSDSFCLRPAKKEIALSVTLR